MTERTRKWALLRRYGVAAFCVLLVTLTLPGCWDYENISMRASLIGIGIDAVPNDPKKVHITVQFPILSAQGGGGGQTGSAGAAGATNNFQNLSADAYSITEGLHTIQLEMDREMDTSQMRAIIISDQLPAEQMDGVIGQMMRLPLLNTLAYLIATPGTAESLLNTTVRAGAPMDFVDRAFKMRQQGYVVHRQLWEYWRDTTQIGAVPVLPIASVEKDQTGATSLRFGGIEAYSGGKRLLSLSKNETFLLNLLTGSVVDMGFDAPINDSIVSLTDVRATSRLGCNREGRRVVLIDHVKLLGTLGKIAKSSPEPKGTDVVKLQGQIGKYLTEQTTALLKKMQEHKVDVVGFGRYYLQKYPSEEATFDTHWSQMFATAKLDVQVDVEVATKGALI